MNPPLVHCVILSWNGKQLTLDCIRSALQMYYPNFLVIVVDNHSSDATADAVRKNHGRNMDSGKVVLIENPDNLGFAAGNNVGMRYAIGQGAEYVLLLNNDTVVDPNLLAELVRESEARPMVGIAGPKIYYIDPPDQIWFAGGEVRLYKGVSKHTGIREPDRGQFDEIKYCDYVTGCAMMIKKRVVEAIGYLDSAYPLYAEDADYCFRAAQKGFRMLYVPGGRVWHKISASTGGQVSRKKITLRFRSSFLFYRRYARWYHWFSIPFFFVLDALRILMLILLGTIRNR